MYVFDVYVFSYSPAIFPFLRRYCQNKTTHEIRSKRVKRKMMSAPKKSATKKSTDTIDLTSRHQGR